MGILILKDYLSIDPSLTVTTPNNINYPRTFQLKNYKEDIDKLFIQHRKYKSSEAIGKYEEHTSEIFADILLKPFIINTTSTKIKYSLYYIFHHYSIETFRNEATNFAKAVEREV